MTMAKSAHIISALNRKVFAICLLATLAVGLLSMVWQTAIFTKELEERSYHSAVNFVSNMVPSIARASWQVNEGAIAVMLDTLLEQPGVVFVAFQDVAIHAHVGDAQFGEAGQHACQLPIRRDLSAFSFQGQSLGRSELFVCFEVSSLVGLPLTSLLQEQFPLFFCVVLVAVLISACINWLIVRPLQRLAQHLTHGESIEDFCRYDKSWEHFPDELDRLIEELIKRTRQLKQERYIVDVSIPEVSDAIAQTDRHFLVTRCNRAMQLIANTDNDNTLLRLSDYFDESILRQPGMHDDVLGPDGRQYELRTVSFGPGADGGFLYVIRDLTADKDLQLQAIHEGKMRSLGVLSSGVAHDFNNILAGILGNAELLLEALEDNEKARESLGTIIEFSERGASLSSQLLSFARRKTQSKTVFPADKAVDNLLKIARPLISKSVFLSTNVLTKKLIDADSGLLDSALMNLLTNAIDAFEREQGVACIVIELSECTRGAQQYVCFQVTDNGKGMAVDVLERMREPFFTTKRGGRGTGLGIAMVSGFAEQSGGMFEIESEEGVWTTVRLIIPVATKERISACFDKPECSDWPISRTLDSGRVLIVEDELSIREVAELVLSRNGYSVSCCGSLDDVKRHGFVSDRFDLVLCDVVLERGSALDVMDFFHRAGNSSPFALISGNFTTDFMAKLEAYGDVPTLDKPYRNSDLVRFVQTQLEKNRSVGNLTEY